MSIPDTVIEAAARALSGLTPSQWEAAPAHVKDTNRWAAQIALTAAYPLMEAQAKAAAWDEVIARIDLGAPFMVDEKYVAGANWVRSQIEDVLKPTIERKGE